MLVDATYIQDEQTLLEICKSKQHHNKKAFTCICYA